MRNKGVLTRWGSEMGVEWCPCFLVGFFSCTTCSWLVPQTFLPSVGSIRFSFVRQCVCYLYSVLDVWYVNGSCKRSRRHLIDGLAYAVGGFIYAQMQVRPAYAAHVLGDGCVAVPFRQGVPRNCCLSSTHKHACSISRDKDFFELVFRFPVVWKIVERQAGTCRT